MDPLIQDRTKKEAAQFDQDFGDVFNQSTTNLQKEDMDAFLGPEETTQTQGAPGSTGPNTEQSLDENGNVLDTVTKVAGAVGADVVGALPQAPRHVVRGAIKGVNSMIGLIDGVTDMMPHATTLNDQGDMGLPRFVTQGMFEDRLNKRREKQGKSQIPDKIEIPNLEPAKDKTVTGQLIEGVSQFLVGFKGVDKIADLAKAGGAVKVGEFLKGGSAASTVTRGALADLLAFDQHEQRLSNVIQSVPGLQNPVTEWLAADDKDGALEGKVKQAIEGTIGGTLGEALFRGIKFMKNAKSANDTMAAEGMTPDDLINKTVGDQNGVELKPENFSDIGDASNPELIIKKFHKEADIVKGGPEQVAKTGDKLAAAEKDVAKIPAASVSGDAKPLGGKAEITINFARIQGDDDVKNLMQQLANDPDLVAGVQAARRGTQSTEQTLAGANDIDGFDELMTRRTGEAFNDQQITAARKVYYDTTNKVLELARKAAGPTATDLDQFMFRKMMAVHQAVQKEVLGARAEAGRALRAWSIPLEGTGGQNVKAVEEMLNEYGGSGATKDLAKRLTSLSQSGQLTAAQINVLTNGGALARTGKALINVWQMGLLTSPRTHVVNVTSNAMTGLLLGAEKMSASLMRDTPITAREAVEYYIGYLGSFKEALSNAAHAFKTRETGMGMGKIDLPPISPASREILDPEGKAGIFSKGLAMYAETLNKVVGGGLAAGDEFAKTTLYRGQLRALATRQGIAQGLKGDDLSKFIADGVTNPDAYVKSDAMEFAAYGTYTNALEGGSAAIQRFVAKVPAARLVVPFVRTPLNIFKFTFSRTPLGLISQTMRDDLSAGGLRRSQAMAKLGTGTSVMMLGTDMAMNGHITGAGPTDPEIRSRLRSTGWRPYSLKIGEEYYSYSRFEPFATWLGMASDMTEIMTNYEAYDVQSQDQIDELVTAGVAAIANQVVGKTFLQGISDLTQVLSDSKRYGPQYLQQYAGSLVPAGVADIEKATSPEAEQVFNMMDAIKARIPGLSADVPKRRNVYGEVIKNYTPGEGWDGVPERLAQMVNPVMMSDPDAKDQKLDEWFLANGIDGPNMPQKTQSFADPRSFGRVSVSVDLREYPEIYNRFLELRGEMKLPQYQNMPLKQYLGGLVDKRVPGSTIFFNGFSTDKEKQGQIIAGIVSDYDRAIRKQLVTEFPVLQQTIIEEQAQQKQENANAGAQGLVRKKSFP